MLNIFREGRGGKLALLSPPIAPSSASTETPTSRWVMSGPDNPSERRLLTLQEQKNIAAAGTHAEEQKTEVCVEGMRGVLAELQRI